VLSQGFPGEQNQQDIQIHKKRFVMMGWVTELERLRSLVNCRLETEDPGKLE
jgi:hypothetical protein